MAVGLMLQQSVSLLKGLDDGWVGILQHIEAGKRPGVLGEGARLVDRTKHRQAIFLAGMEVIHAMARCGVHEASP